MHAVSTFRLYLLRATYLLLVIGLGLDIWPLLLDSPSSAEHMRGVVWSLLAAVSLLAALGVRYPLQMLPLLLFELVWKSIWILAIALPSRSASPLDGAMLETWYACLIGLVVVAVAMPWGYVFRHYVRKPADRWNGRSTSVMTSSPSKASAQALRADEHRADSIPTGRPAGIHEARPMTSVRAVRWAFANAETDLNPPAAHCLAVSHRTPGLWAGNLTIRPWRSSRASPPTPCLHARFRRARFTAEAMG